MNAYVSLQQDGTMQLPDWVLDRLGIVPGELLEFAQNGDEIVIRRKKRDIQALVAKYSRYSEFAPQTEEEFAAQMRAERGQNELSALYF